MLCCISYFTDRIVVIDVIVGIIFRRSINKGSFVIGFLYANIGLATLLEEIIVIVP